MKFHFYCRHLGMHFYLRSIDLWIKGAFLKKIWNGDYFYKSEQRSADHFSFVPWESKFMILLRYFKDWINM